MTRLQAERWAVTRASGRTVFVWLYGVALWGLGMTVLSALISVVMQGGDSLFDVSPTPVFGGLIGGYVWGAYVWRTSEAAFARFLERRDANNAG
ncbi:MAG TPA: hypothetical protein VGE52_20360 [Pirellulales bacterium]